MRVEDEVLEVLSASRTEGNALYLTGQLDRKMLAWAVLSIAAVGAVLFRCRMRRRTA